MKDKILNYISKNMESDNYEACSSLRISETLKVSKNQITLLLNQMCDENLLIKIKRKPFIFLNKVYLENKYNIEITKKEVDSFDALNDLLNMTKEKDFDKLIGHNESMNQIVEKLKAIVSYPPNGLPTLLYGPTGTGKSFMAKLTFEYCRNIHLIDENAQFVQVNCSEYANNPELLTANLFGYKKGAFTGADKDNLGLLHYANGGVLFLDEVHCLKAECQEKLFLYMDQGIYHLVGDNDKWYKSKCRIIFATTEDPKKVLLKTLIRRIPVVLNIPSLNQRGTNEKLELIYSLYKKEEKRINKKIKISSNVYQILLNHEFSGNIGELSNTIQASCVSALFNSNNDFLEIHTYDLPETVISTIDVNHLIMKKHQMLSLDRLIPTSKQSIILELYNELIEIDKNSSYYQNAKKVVDEYFSKIIFNKSDVSRTKYYLETVNRVFEIVTSRYGFHLSHNELVAIATYILEYNSNIYHIINWINGHSKEVEELNAFLQTKYHQEYVMSKEIYDYFKDNFNNSIDIFVQFIILLCLVKYVNHENNDLTIAIILAHGYSTASSIADSANKLLDKYVFEAIDMPLDVDSIQITKKINEYVSTIGNVKKLYLLVDMGSLEDIYQGIERRNIDIALINNVNTKLALTVGQGIIQDKSMKSIFDSIQKRDFYNVHIEMNYQKEPVILCSCASGMGTAHKLKEIVLDSLPKDIHIEVIAYDYHTLLTQHTSDDFLAEYKVICVIGTLNPNIDDYPFIAIEDLIINEGFNKIKNYFGNYLNNEQMQLFEKNIIKNFSLSNVINNLTILNPNKLLEHVSSGIDQLQQLMDCKFKNQTCFGLYVHICCLIERLVTKQAITAFDDENFEKNHNDFIILLRKSMKSVEDFYNVQIPVEEIEYIYEYIKND